MARWLMKSEPDVFGWDDLVAKHGRGETEQWHGVRNYAARNHMMAMKLGDEAFFYHSNIGKEIVGIMKVVAEAHPDSTAELKNGKVVWQCVDVAPVRPLKRPVTLEDVKAAVPLNVNTIARVVATEGIFDRGTDRMELTAPFDVNLSNGTTAKFQSAELDVVAGTLNTDDPVSIDTEQASIVAQSLKITDKGRTITFAGQVRVTIEAAAIRNRGS